MTETDNLRFIQEAYGDIIGTAARLHRHRPEVMAGIIMRETEGGLSRYLDRKGPAGRGDGGHGHGLMQIDDRSFPDFCHGPHWADPDKNIHFGAWVLSRKRAFLAPHCPEELLERASLAAYNCGEGTVLKLLFKRLDVDVKTAHGHYSAEVLRFAEIYKQLIEEGRENVRENVGHDGRG